MAAGVAVGFWALADDRLVPAQLYTLVLAPGLALSVAVPPLQIYPLFVGAAEGVAFTVTEVVYIVAGLQPLSPLPSLTVTEYTPVTVGESDGVGEEELYPPGPLQLNVVAPPAPLAASATVPPLQIGPSFVGAAVGVLRTVTVVTYTVDGAQPGLPLPLVTCSE